MRVLIVPSWYPTKNRSNRGIFFKEQAIALKEQGLEVLVAFPEIHILKELKRRNFKRGFYYSIEDNVETYRIKEYNFLLNDRGYSFIYYLALKKIFAKLMREGKKPDIIHAHSALWGGWAAAKISKQHDIPLIITEHSSAFIRGLLKEYQKRFIKEAFEQAKKVIVVSPSLEKELEKYTEKEKIILIPNIVNTSLFKPTDNIRKSEKFRFFSLAFLTHNKGFDLLLKAFAKAFKGNEEVELVIGGDGEERGNLEKLAVDLGIEKQVTFLGELSREQAAMEMQKCDVFVLASRFETFGVVFIEALACGKPIIATKCGGPEMIVNENNGLLVNSESIEELSSALSKIKISYGKYEKEEIVNDCYIRFGKERVSKQIISEYLSVVNNRVKPD